MKAEALMRLGLLGTSYFCEPAFPVLLPHSYSHWTNYGRGQFAVQCSAIANLAKVVPPPAIDQRGRGFPASQQLSGAELTKAESTPDGHRDETLIMVGAIANSTIDVHSPAVPLIASCFTAGVGTTGRKPTEAESATHEPGLRSLRRRSITDLAGGAAAPAKRPGLSRHGTGVRVPSRDLSKDEGSRNRRGAHPPQHCGPVAEIVLVVVTPAERLVGSCERAGVEGAGRHLAEAPAAIHRYRPEPSGGRAIAQLTEVIVPPAVDSTGAGQATGVLHAG